MKHCKLEPIFRLYRVALDIHGLYTKYCNLRRVIVQHETKRKIKKVICMYAVCVIVAWSTTPSK